MSERFTRADLKRLARIDQHPCLSMYLPTHRAIPETRQDPIRFKNLIQQATEALIEAGCRRTEAEKILEPAESRRKDEAFWNHQSDGLAMFLAEGFSEEYRLRRSFEERVVVNNAFHVTPLLPLAHGNGRFHVLAISQNSCRLFRGDRDEIVELEVDELPADLQSALGWWREREVNFHSHFTGGRPGAGKDTAMFHGHEEDDKQIDLTAYFRRVVKALRPETELRQTPLVFAGVEELYPIFKDVADDLTLIDGLVPGNPDRLSSKDLQRAAWKIVEPHYRADTDRLTESFYKLEKNGRATRALAAILPAARDGLVETLLLNADAEQPGVFNRETGQILSGEAENATDVLNLATILTLRTDGEVIPSGEQLPDGVAAVAILRAPVDSIATPSLVT